MDTDRIITFSVLTIVFIIIAIVLTNWFSYRLKRRLLDVAPPDEKLLRLIGDLWKPGSEALKWGLLFFTGGLGLIIIDCIPNRGDSFVLPFGIEAVSLSAGFLGYYFFIGRKR